MANYIVKSTYTDGTVKTLETTDGKRAMQECSSACWNEDIAKTVTLTKDGESIYSEKVGTYKDEQKKNEVVSES